jgi:hypothetical protein
VGTAEPEATTCGVVRIHTAFVGLWCEMNKLWLYVATASGASPTARVSVIEAEFRSTTYTESSAIDGT